MFSWRILSADIRTRVERCRIPKDRLNIGREQLGRGHFGLVLKGQLITPSGNMKTVAVKSMKGKYFFASKI